MPATSRKRSWSREEAVLALDLYLNGGLQDIEARKALSERLRIWPVEPELTVDPSFRNEQSVRNKLYNFQYLDTDGAHGREKGGAVTRAAWEEFGPDVEAVAAAAAELDETVAPADGGDRRRALVDDLVADESGWRIVKHRKRERSRALVEAKKQKAIEDGLGLTCEACGFNSEVKYDIPGVIECHHVKPVSEVKPGEKTSLDDLRLVCPTCHRLIHKKRPWLDWDELVALVSNE